MSTSSWPPRGLFHPRHWPGWLGIGLAVLCAQLPLPVARAAGAAFGTLLRWARPKRLSIARTNLELCFPELDPAARAALLRASFRSLGIGLLEFARAWWGPLGRLPRTTQVEGLEHLAQARAQGRGVLLLSGHFHTLELCGRLLTLHAPIAGMYRRHEFPVLEWAVSRGRARYATAMFAREELRACIRHLKAGGILWYAPDQDMRGKDAVFAPFFGRPAATLNATHQLARLTGAAVIAFHHRRREDGRGYVLKLEPPLEPFPSDSPVDDAARVNAAIERMVRAAPAEYLWVHRRFKRRPDGGPSLYER